MGYNMELEVEIKNVYGVERIYPINDTALNFSNLTRKCFNLL